MNVKRSLPRSDQPDAVNFIGNLQGRKVVLRKSQSVYSQGSRAEHVFFIRSGHVKLFVLSEQGKEAVVGLLGPGDLFGEWCVSGHVRQLSNAVAVTDCTLLKVAKKKVLSAIHADRSFADFFINYMLRGKRVVEENLVDLMFNSTEKRLARALLLLARFGKKGKPLVTVPRVSQDTLAALIGSTRTQVNPLMKKFKKLGFITYDGGMEVRNSLLNVVLHD